MQTMTGCQLHAVSLVWELLVATLLKLRWSSIVFVLCEKMLGGAGTYTFAVRVAVFCDARVQRLLAVSEGWTSQCV